MLIKKFKLRQLGKELYEKEAINQASAIPLSNLSKTIENHSFFLPKSAFHEVIKMTEEGYFYLNLEAYLKFRREYNQRLFLLITNIVIVLTLFVMLVIAWFLNAQFFS